MKGKHSKMSIYCAYPTLGTNALILMIRIAHTSDPHTQRENIHVQQLLTPYKLLKGKLIVYYIRHVQQIVSRYNNF